MKPKIFQNVIFPHVHCTPSVRGNTVSTSLFAFPACLDHQQWAFHVCCKPVDDTLFISLLIFVSVCEGRHVWQSTNFQFRGVSESPAHIWCSCRGSRFHSLTHNFPWIPTSVAIKHLTRHWNMQISPLATFTHYPYYCIFSVSCCVAQ